MSDRPAAEAASAQTRPARGAGQTAAALAVCALLAYLLTAGGRIVGSDELAQVELSRALLHGRIAVPPGATLQGPDGRHYTKNAAGQAVAALPFAALGEALAQATPQRFAGRELLVRAVVSLFNALVGALLLAAFYAVSRALGATRGAALGGALLLGFATPAWVYAKSFMGEPLQGLGLLLAAGGMAVARVGDARGARWAALGVVLAVSTKLSMLPLAILAVAPLLLSRAWPLPAAAMLASLAGHALYNWARFGTPLETGYGPQATPSAYTTPLWVGVYGLLLSSGKGLLWFAPPVWLAPGGARSLLRRSPPAVAAVLAMVVTALAVYGTFEHWAGDGSFGPRYLLPLLPLLLVPVALRLSEPGARWARRAAWALGMAGILVQAGGVGVYFGAQMRERGDYPYMRALSDPRFMSESRWNPYFSPIADHWRMLRRNLAEHVAGRMPRVAVGPVAASDSASARTGLDPAEERALLHGLDFWWAYALYAGVPGGLVAATALALAALLIGAALRLRAAWVAEAGP